METIDNPDSLAGVEFYSGILIPDMVNAHCHLELSYMRGVLQGGEGFAGFARAMAPARHDVPRHYVALQASVEDARLWAEGVGAVGDICNSTDTFGIKRESRMEYINFLELFGLGQTSAQGLMPLAQAASDASLPFAVTPHSTYSLNDDAFVSAVRGLGEPSEGFCTGDVADGRNRLPLSIHFMESPQEAEMFRKRGELWDWNRERGMEMPFTDIYGSPADRITALVPAERDIMLVHNCCVTEEDIDKIDFHFKGRVTWVLCPRSNEFISRIAPPVSLLRRKGAHIAVGTDSLASNRSLSMAEELKCFEGVPVEELLCWATENGARALNSECRSSFETGSRTGVVRVTGIDLNNMSVTDRLRMKRII